MGCCLSAPKTVDSAKTSKTNSRRQSATKAPVEPVPDLGLKDTHLAIKPLGRGGTGETWLCRDRVTNELVAVKLMKRPVPNVIKPNVTREIRIQADLGEGHVNIINAIEAILTQQHLALVLEYASEGSLTGYVAERWQTGRESGLFLSENEARYFFRQFINAVEYCHSHFVAHRDLKLDNTLLSGGDPPVIKLCDFGFAKDWEGDLPLITRIGTPVYMSPELIDPNSKGYDGRCVDIWASGVLLIVMLLGQFPYDHIQNPDPNSPAAALEVLNQQLVQWRNAPTIKPLVSKLSPECADLLDQIFVVSPDNRITLDNIKAHPWFNKPMEPRYAEAEKLILAEQEKLDAHARARVINGDLLKARNQAIHDMTEHAVTRAPPTVVPPTVRVDLRESAIIGTAPEVIPEVVDEV